MTLDRKRWALKARELRFSQLEVARDQAESWRTGLSAVTGLLTVVFVLKGRDNVSDLGEPAQAIVVVLLGVALLALLGATLWLSRALAGRPGDQILLTPRWVQDWTHREVASIFTALRWAIRLSALGVALISAAVVITWLAPAQDAGNPLVRVASPSGDSCGGLVGVSQHELVVQTTAGTTLIPMTTIAGVKPVASCG